MIYLNEAKVVDTCNRLTDFLLTELEYDEPSLINEGACWMWALLASKINGGVINIHINSVTSDIKKGHMFIYWNRKYRDSESPKGVLHWANLPFFKRIKTYGIEVEHRYEQRCVRNTDLNYILSWCNNPKHIEILPQLNEKLHSLVYYESDEI